MHWKGILVTLTIFLLVIILVTGTAFLSAVLQYRDTKHVQPGSYTISKLVDMGFMSKEDREALTNAGETEAPWQILEVLATKKRGITTATSGAGGLSSEVPEEYRDIIMKAAAQCDELSPGLMAAQVWAESNWNANATSSVGAQGIAQFMPSTWATYGKDGDGDGKADINNPKDSIMGQGNYMCHLLTKEVPAAKAAHPKENSSYSDEKIALLMYNGGFSHGIAHPEYCNDGRPAGTCSPGASAGDYADKILGAVSRFQTTATLAMAGGSGTWVAPHTGAITSRYGPRAAPVAGASTFHRGVDIGAGCNEPYVSATDGVVTFAGLTSGGMGVITVNHGGGIYTQYQHSYQDGILVKKGDRVSTGQVIGKVGSSGPSSGCHLHFETHEGVPDGATTVFGQGDVNPEPFMAAHGAPLENNNPTVGSTVSSIATAMTTNELKPYQWALQQAGKTYVSGAAGPNSYDCSGLVGSAFLNTIGKKQDFWGIKAENKDRYIHFFTTYSFRDNAARYGFTKLPWKNGDGEKGLQPGDVMLTDTHIAFYIGNGKQMHASEPSRGVLVDPLRTNWTSAWRFDGANGAPADSIGTILTSAIQGTGYSLPEFTGGTGPYHLDVEKVKKLNEQALEAEQEMQDFANRVGRYAMSSYLYSTYAFNIDGELSKKLDKQVPHNTIADARSFMEGFHSEFYLNHATGQVVVQNAGLTPAQDILELFTHTPAFYTQTKLYEEIINRYGVDENLLHTINITIGDSTVEGYIVGANPDDICPVNTNVAGIDIVSDKLCEKINSELDLFKYLFTIHNYPAFDGVRGTQPVHLDEYQLGVDFGEVAARNNMNHVVKQFKKHRHMNINKQDSTTQQLLDNVCLGGQPGDLSNVQLEGWWANPLTKKLLISPGALFDGSLHTLLTDTSPQRDTFFTCSAFYNVDEMIPTVPQNYQQWYASLTSLDYLDDVFNGQATDVDGETIIINIDGTRYFGEEQGKYGNQFWDWVKEMCATAQEITDEQIDAEINLQQQRSLMKECHLDIDADGNITDNYIAQTVYIKKCLNAYMTDNQGLWMEDHRLAYDVVPDANGEAAISQDKTIKPLQVQQRSGWVRAIKTLPISGMDGKKAGQVYDIAKKWAMGNVTNVGGGAGVSNCSATQTNPTAGTSGDPGGEFGEFTIAQRSVSDHALEYARNKNIGLSAQKTIIATMLADGRFDEASVKSWIDTLADGTSTTSPAHLSRVSGANVNQIKKFLKEATTVLDGYSGGTLSCTTGQPATLNGTDPDSAKAYAKSKLSEYGWTDNEFEPLEKLWTRESGWNYTAQNPSSGAYGIPQSLPGSKMATAGADWETNPATQINWGLKYIKDRYGSPSGAWEHSERHGWY